MHSAPVAHRLSYRFIGILLGVLMAVPSGVQAQENTDVRLELRPRCEQESNCPSFEVRDPLSVRTPVLAADAPLEMDLVLHNPQRLPIHRFRVWIAYDPMLLAGVQTSISDAFPTPTPGEIGFDASTGFLRLSGTATEPVTEESIVLAHITFRVQQAQSSGTPLSFFNDPDTPEPESGVFAQINGTEQNILPEVLGYLFVRMEMSGMPAPATPSPSVPEAPPSVPEGGTGAVIPPSHDPIATPPSTAFPLLQVQGLRVTTEGSSVYLAWDALPSSELIGYHLYYGTVSGQYIQRRSIDHGATSTAIRTLPVGETYYFAIRGVNAEQNETDFSREVGVSVGNPGTSTAPFTASALPTPTPVTDGSLAGDTGIPSSLAILLLVSAGIGTFVAFRRQLAAQQVPHRS